MGWMEFMCRHGVNKGANKKQSRVGSWLLSHLEMMPSYTAF